MKLLQEGIAQGFVEKTNRATKLTIDGVSEDYPIYRVQLPHLYYNDQNDRIATWISQYKSEHHITDFDKSNMEAYNGIIHHFITLSNPEKLKATQKNIMMIEQQKYGVVLNDGRIIDGNRRFTCLRNLAKSNPKFNYFETIILDKDIENDARQIKMLELNIQIGEEAKVDYDPVDRLVGVYHAIIETQLLTVHDYAVSTGASSDNDVIKQVEEACLMSEFLETIKVKGQYHIARVLNIAMPLNELHAILKKVKDEETQNDVKKAVFLNLLMQPEGDMTRFIRQLKKIVGSAYMDEFLEKELLIADSTLALLPDDGTVTKDIIMQIRKDEAIKSELRHIMDIIINKVGVAGTKDKPNQILIKTLDSLGLIDTNIFKKLTDDQKDVIGNNLTLLENKISEIKAALRAGSNTEP